MGQEETIKEGKKEGRRKQGIKTMIKERRCRTVSRYGGEGKTLNGKLSAVVSKEMPDGGGRRRRRGRRREGEGGGREGGGGEVAEGKET